MTRNVLSALWIRSHGMRHLSDHLVDRLSVWHEIKGGNLEQQNTIFENLCKSASAFVVYLTTTYPGQYDDIYARFKNYILANKPQDFMEIYHDYDPTSIFQYDGVLMTFSRFCHENIHNSVLRDYKIQTIVDTARGQFNLDTFISFKKMTSQEIISLVRSRASLLAIIDEADIFGYHMGYNPGYSARRVVTGLEMVLLTDKEKSKFEDYKTTIQKARETIERKASEDYYLERHEKRRHRKS